MPAGTLKFDNKKDAAAIGRAVLLAVAKVLKKAAKAAEKGGGIEIALTGERQKKKAGEKPARGKKVAEAKKKKAPVKKAAVKPKRPAPPPANA